MNAKQRGRFLNWFTRYVYREEDCSFGGSPTNREKRIAARAVDFGIRLGRDMGQRAVDPLDVKVTRTVAGVSETYPIRTLIRLSVQQVVE